MHIKHFLVCSFLFLSCFSSAQINISGFINDETTGENLIGARVYDLRSKKGVLTNNYGYFTLQGNKGDTLDLIFSFVTYLPKSITLILDKDSSVSISLKPNNLLGVVEVSTELPIEKRNEISVLSLPLDQIKLLPSLTGEVDIMRAYQLLPGVQSGREGTSGIYVRGGSPDQNLFLVDDIPLYYVSHIGGFVSVFDINAINTMQLYKGGFPSKFGGRISSVVDIRMNEGNNQKMKAEIGVGLLSTKFFIEGPIKKDTSSFFLSVRRCNVDLFTRTAAWYVNDYKTTAGYTFYDVNAKYTRRINEKSKLQFVFYAGRDRIFLSSKQKDEVNNSKYTFDSNVKWGNIMGQTKYICNLSPKIFLNTTLGFTRFNYNTAINVKQIDLSTGNQKGESSIDFSSGVMDFIAKADFEYFANEKNKFGFGIEGVYHTFKPGITSKQTIGNYTSADSTSGINKLNSQEIKVYFNDEIKFSRRIFANIGVHALAYFVQGKTIFSIQPRALLNYNFTERSTIKVGYSRMNQNIHLLTNSGTGLPTDLWVPATSNLRPEISDQITVAYVQSFSKNNMYELTLEAYWKKIDNLIDYKEGSNFLSIGSNWENAVVGNGTGDIKGIEVLLQKTKGKLKGWIAYTLSKNTRQFDEINNGDLFYFKYDRRHNLSVVATYDINENISLSATWVLGTGNPITLAQGKYDLLVSGFNWANYSQSLIADNTFQAHIYNGKNAYRLPAYHRLDFGITFKKEKPRGLRSWQFGIYNVYNKLNPFFLYYKSVDSNIKLFQLSLFPILPSVSYTFRFN